MNSLRKKSSDIFPSRFFDDDFLGFPNLFDRNMPYWNTRSMQIPPANISETKDAYKIDLSAPGLQRSDFKVEMDDNILTISCEKKEENKEDKENYKSREFSYSSFSRSFQLPDNVAEEKINAKYDNGMLHISIPKKESGSTRPKKSIDVN